MSASRKPAPELRGWSISGPTNASGNLLILDPDGVCVATIKGTQDGKQRRALAILMSRAPVLRAMLEHLETTLSEDDQGSRWGPELTMIREELIRSALPETVKGKEGTPV